MDFSNLVFEPVSEPFSSNFDETTRFTVDLAFFREPDECSKISSHECDWTQVGVGAKDNAGRLRRCCTEESYGLGTCAEGQLGRMILVPDQFDGSHRFIQIPATGNVKYKLKYPLLQVQQSGEYVVAFSNCNVDGRQVHVSGDIVWKGSLDESGNEEATVTDRLSEGLTECGFEMGSVFEDGEVSPQFILSLLELSTPCTTDEQEESMRQAFLSFERCSNFELLELGALRLGVRFLAVRPLSATNHFYFRFFSFMKKISGQNENDHAGLLDHPFEFL